MISIIRKRIFFKKAFSTMPVIKYRAGPSDEFRLKIGNYQIHFPFKPYECQREYMEKVINSLESGTNAALESPTGTGKTLSLLCSTIEWVLRQKEMPKIYYASRTHHQLKQVIKELNKTEYKNMIKVATLASRDHLCLLQSVLESSHKTEMCQAKILQKSCTYFKHLLRTNTPNVFYFKYLMTNKALDLNDVKELAQQNHHCPFYVARGMGKLAKLIFLPYNYLIDPEILLELSIELEGNILIFDEAHNMESTAENSMSTTFSTKTLQKTINELWEAIKLMEKYNKNRNDNNEMDTDEQNLYEQLYELLEEKSKMNWEEERKLYGKMMALNGQINAMDLKKEGIRISTKVEGRAFLANKLIELLKTSGIDDSNWQQICGLINSICSIFHLILQIDKNNSKIDKNNSKVDRNKFAQFNPILRGIYLTRFKLFLSKIFISIKDQDASSLNNNFKLFVEEKENLTGGGNREILLNYWCFNASIAMHFLESFGTHSILFTSGTLAPLDTFMATMGIKFGQKMESIHCAHQNNLMFKIVQNGPNNIPLLGTFKNRNSFNYKQSISELLFKLARITPQGMLVFFPSYRQMNNFIEHLKDTKMCNGRQIWAELNQQKRIFVEPKEKADILQLFNDFDATVRTNPNGAILFSVCRGKLSEGIDFADNHCRSVVIIGIPFPPCYDPRVMLKKEYLIEQNKRAKNANKMGPYEWYKNEATRAVNQAIGRVIRHKNDFGTVILADSRYARMNRQAFPLWIRPSIEKNHPPSFNSILPSIEQFFIQKGISMKHIQSNWKRNGQ